MGVLQDYFDFVMEHAPYFYYIPGSGVDPEWGRGPAAAAHAIDFLYQCYSNASFEAEKTNIKNKIVELHACIFRIGDSVLKLLDIAELNKILKENNLPLVPSD